MSVAARVSQEMGVKLGNEVSVQCDAVQDEVNCNFKGGCFALYSLAINFVVSNVALTVSGNYTTTIKL